MRTPMKNQKRLVIGGMLAATAGGLCYAGGECAGGVVTGLDTPMIAVDGMGSAARYRDINGEYKVRPAHVRINGFGFRPGGGVVRGKAGAIPVSRYALRFDDAPFPLNDLQITGKKGTQLSGVVRVPQEILSDSEIDKPRSFRVYDRVEGRFVKTLSKDAATVRFTLSTPTSSCSQAQVSNPPVHTTLQ